MLSQVLVVEHVSRLEIESFRFSFTSQLCKTRTVFAVTLLDFPLEGETCVLFVFWFFKQHSLVHETYTMQFLGP